MTRIALVTGANQGLGLALATGLAHRLDPDDLVLLTGRDARRVEQAAAAVEGARAEVRPRVLDVRDGAAIRGLANELGSVDIVFSNATARLSPNRGWPEQIDTQVETSNVATTDILRAFVPRLRPGGRLLVVASSLGQLKHLPCALHPRFATDSMTLDDVDALTREWQAQVHAGTEEAAGWPAWINIPSKVLQVAAVRIAARDAPEGTLVAALCPGLVDTGASRPWFDDMSRARTPEQAAQAPLKLALDPLDPAFAGELVRDGEVLPWDPAG